MAESAILILEDGRVFEGELFGAPGTVVGAVVSDSSMTGYQELLSDPEHQDRILALTYPLIGNCGITAGAPPVTISGLVIHQAPPLHSHWQAEESLESFLRSRGVVGISGVDQRALARHLRRSGVRRGAIAPASASREELLERIRSGQGLREPLDSDA